MLIDVYAAEPAVILIILPPRYAEFRHWLALMFDAVAISMLFMP